MQAGDVGIKITVYPNKTGSDVSLTGATCSGVIRKPDGEVEQLALDVAPDGLSAVYYTTGDDFDLPGEYQFQLYADWGAGRVRHGKIAKFDAGEIIPLPPVI